MSSSLFDTVVLACVEGAERMAWGRSSVGGGHRVRVVTNNGPCFSKRGSGVAVVWAKATAFMAS